MAGRDETGVDRWARAEFLDRFVTLGDDAINRLAGLTLGPLADDLEYLFKALDLALCLLAMGREGFLQFGVLSGFHKLGESPINLLLRVVDILQMRQEEVV